MTDSPAPTPAEIFDRAVDEGKRRLDQSMLELISTSFIAGFTIVFGIVALGLVEASLEPVGSEIAHLGGALAFGFGVVFLVVGRVELFNENFFDPSAAVVEDDSLSLPSLGRLWLVTLVFNLAGGGLFAAVFVVDGVLPTGAKTAFVTFATESVNRGVLAWFASAIAGGALVSLLSFLLLGANRVESRITLAYIVGFLLAIGPFDHVIVTALHLLFGILSGASIEYGRLGSMLLVVTLGNFVGGLGLVTFTHVAQAVGADESEK